MSTPVSRPTSQATPAHSSTPAILPASSPIGLGAQPTTLSPVSDSGILGTVADYSKAVGNFFRKLIINILKGIRSVLDLIITFCDDDAETVDPVAANWQLPQVAPMATAISDPFSELPISAEEQHKIYTIIHAMGQVTGWMEWLKLISKSPMITRYGREIENVHSLKFLEYVFKHPELPQDITVFKRYSLTWDPFIKNLSNKMLREAASIPPCKGGFARSLNVNLDDLEPFFARNDCLGMVEFLLDVKMGRKTSIWVEPPAPPPPTHLPLRASSAPALRIARHSLPVSSPQFAIILPPPPVMHTVRIADLPFTKEDEQVLNHLISKYAQNRVRFALTRKPNTKWAQLGERHPLKLLVTLRSNPALMTQLNTIFQDTERKERFLNALTDQLAKQPIVEVRPYLDEFATFCQLDPNCVRGQVEEKNWKQIVIDIQMAQRPIKIS